MPLDSDGDDDASAFGAPLPPDDRLWRHPSEVGAAVVMGPPAPFTPADRRRGPVLRPWGVGLVSGMVGAALVIGVVALVGGFQTRVVERTPVERVQLVPTELSGGGGPDDPTASNGAPDVVAIAAATSPSVAELRSSGADASWLGSAVVFRTDGYLLTTVDAIGTARTLAVALADGRVLTGEVVGSDPQTDIAVIRVQAPDLAAAMLGSSATLDVGAPVVAIGSYLGLDGGPSVTTGVVSATGRRVERSGAATLHGLLQTDAPLSAAASGGALCDRNGAVIGIIAPLAMPGSSSGSSSLSGSSPRMGFAVPIELARSVATSIIQTGSVSHAWLGVEGVDLTRSTAQALGVDGGAVISTVVAGGPADDGGLRSGDVVTSIDGTAVASMGAMVSELRTHQPGDQVEVGYLRDGEAATTDVGLGAK